VERHTILSSFIAVILLLFFVPSLLTVASTLLNIIGVSIGFTSGYILFVSIATFFDRMNQLGD
jgi:hypothetical protein